MSVPEPSDIRAVLSTWKSAGWVDVDNSAMAVARKLAGGANAHDAASVVSGAFLERNATSRTIVARALERTSDKAIQRHGERETGRIVVLTAIPPEYEAMVAHLQTPSRLTTATGTRYLVGTVEGADCIWEVAVAEIGPGNIGAATEVASATSEFDPDLFVFVGVAGGLKDDLPYGSVVVANLVHYYEMGRAEKDEWRARPISLPTPHRLTQLAIDVARQWTDAKAVVKPIAAGEGLVGATDSEIARIINKHYNDAVAVDMESAGLYLAADRAERPALAIRGISDRLSDKDGDTDAKRQPQAARNAASFAVSLLRAADRTVLDQRSSNGST